MNRFNRNKTIKNTLRFQLICVLLFGVGYLILYLMKKGVIDSPFLQLIGLGLTTTTLILFPIVLLFLIIYILVTA